MSRDFDKTLGFFDAFRHSVCYKANIVPKLISRNLLFLNGLRQKMRPQICPKSLSHKGLRLKLGTLLPSLPILHILRY